MLQSVFISYSHKDERWKNLLLTHFEPFVESGRISPWHDRMIDPGEEWYDDIRNAMARATLAVCLLSPDFLTSDFCTREEVGYLLERRQRDGLKIVPVLVRPCSWQTIAWMRALQLLPRDAKAISDAFAGRESEAFSEVVSGLVSIINDPEYQPTPAATPEWPELDERSIYLERLPVTGYELFGRRPQIENLDLAWKSPGINVTALVGRGGVGKSTLVGKWLDQMQADNYRGASRVFGWSFHSQGTGERVTSAHEFIVRALEWFGDPDATAGSPWDKAERLADLVRQGRTLLVLDGLEPLQAESEQERGRIKDPALSTLLTELAHQNTGLCVVTTRETILDLGDFPESALQENLERVSVEAGRAILRVGRVIGSDRALEALSRQFGCGALALKLLAAYLRGTEKRGVTDADSIPQLDVPEDQGRHARRVLAAFAQRLQGGPELEALRVIALFDRPAQADQIRALRREPAIRDLTEQLSALDEGGWMRLMDGLRDQSLIAFREPGGDIDTHPIVREHFSAELRDRFPAAWREGHGRIYEHLKQSSEWRPETLDGMMPLFSAVAHGCHAGRWQDAAENVVWSRIQREREDFSTVWLGASGPVLAALASLFAARWSQTLPLPIAKQAYVLSQTSGCLERLGRFAEALEATVSAFQIDVTIAQTAPPMSQSHARSLLAAGQDANTVAEHLLVLGPLSQAGGEAQEALRLVYEATNRFWMVVTLTTTNRFWLVVTLTTIAEVYHLMNLVDKAEECFGQAESLHRELKGRWLPNLYARQGFRYCSFLYDQGKHQEVLTRASQAITVKDNWPIDIALDHLSLGRAYLATGDLPAAETHLNDAVNGTRYASESKFIAGSLLARAELRWAQGSADLARADVEKAFRLTRWQGARLLQADCHLLRARMLLEDGEIDRARLDLRAARSLIDATGYHVRDSRVHELEQRT